MDLKGKTIILTGARRIGKNVAHALAAKGANLAVTYFSNEKNLLDDLATLAQASGVRIQTYQADLSQGSAINTLVDQVTSDFGEIGALVHMASPYPETPIGKITMEDFSKITNTITGSTLLLGQKLGLEMQKASGTKVRVENKEVGVLKGKMIFFSDWSVLSRPYPEVAVYNTAKAGVNAATLTLARAFAPEITVNAIAPGPILPPPNLSEEENKESLEHSLLGHWGGPEEIVKAVLYLLDADFVTGVILPVDGGRTIS